MFRSPLAARTVTALQGLRWITVLHLHGALTSTGKQAGLMLARWMLFCIL